MRPADHQLADPAYQKETTVYERDNRVARRKGFPITGFIAGVLFCIAAGLGYASWMLWSQNQQLGSILQKTKRELNGIQQNRVENLNRVSELEKSLAAQKDALNKAEEKNFKLASKQAAMVSEYKELREQRASIAQKMAEFRRVAKQFQRMIDSGKLKVIFRRGRMIVQLPEKVLFPSGSADLTEDGTSALKQVAKILRKVSGKRFIVAGHTDNIPISNEQFPSNWELSTARAVNVTKTLIHTGLRAQRLVAAGHAEFDPVSTNQSKVGRQKNRRIEIVLEPRLSKPSKISSGKTAKTKQQVTQKRS